jgi:hypothetical protein
VALSRAATRARLARIVEQGAPVKASTANRILLWIFGVLIVFGLIGALTGGESERRALGGYLVLGGAIGGLAYLGYKYRILPRRESFAGQARELGLRAEPGDPLGLLERPFVLFRWMASVRQIENTATGPRNGLDVMVADYWFARSSQPERDDYERFTCVLTAAPADWPDLSVVPERIASRMRDVIALPDIGTESAEFDRRFEIRSKDKRFASGFVDGRLMAWLLEQIPGMGFEILGGWLMLFRPRVTTSIDDLGRALDLHEAFLERIPRVVFPGRPDIAGPPG